MKRTTILICASFTIGALIAVGISAYHAGSKVHQASMTAYSLPHDPYARIDDAFDRRLPANVVYNPPERMSLGATEQISLRLGIDQRIEDLVATFPRTSTLETGVALVTPRVSATLSGIGFEIHSHSPDAQALTRREPSTWTWSIKANQPGRQYLHLALSPTVDIDGTATSLSPAIFERAIIVDVSPWRSIAHVTLGNPIISSVIAGLLVLILAGVFRIILRKRKRQTTAMAPTKPGARLADSSIPRPGEPEVEEPTEQLPRP